MFGVSILRYVGLLLGLVTLVLLLVDGVDIRVSALMHEALAGVRELIGTLVWPIELLLVQPAVVWFAKQGFAISLDDHWKSVFVLLWLYFGAVASESARADWKLGSALGTIGAIWALTGGILAGTAHLTDPNVFWYSALAFALYGATTAVWIACFYRREDYSWFDHFRQLVTMAAVRYWLPSIAVLVLVDVATVKSDETMTWTLSSLPLGGLVSLFLCIAVIGVSDVLQGILEYLQVKRSVTVPSGYRFIVTRVSVISRGIQVLSVLGGAIGVVYLGHIMR